MTKEQKKTLCCIIIASVLFSIGLFFSGWFQFGIMITAWIIVGWPVIREAVLTIVHGEVFDECFLMTIATIGAFILKDYAEAAAVMIFFQIGELFDSCAIERSRKSITEILEIRPNSAYLCQGDTIIEIEPEKIEIGNILLVRPGERIPVDGVVLEGEASLNTSQITGESMPLDVFPGQAVMSGCINMSGVLKIQAETTYDQSTIARILYMVESASETKAPAEKMITRFAKVYTPVVVVSALLLAIIPPMFFGNWQSWVTRALAFLVISCPCALVISVPLSYFCGMGAASKQGIIIKGGSVLEQLAKAKIAAFDKTGTLTRGYFQVTGVREAALTKDSILYYAAGAEKMSPHPIAKAICESTEIIPTNVSVIQEIAGQGVIAQVDGLRVLAGNMRLLLQEGISVENSFDGTCIYLAVNGEYGGAILLEDSLKDNAVYALNELKLNGIDREVLLTGDNIHAAHKISAMLPLDEVHANLLPHNKVEEMERLLLQCKNGDTVIYIGDGINDAPVLTTSDVGIAMGGIGSDAAVEAADVVILNDDLNKLSTGLRISKRTTIIAKQNIIFAITIKLIILVLAVLGIASMWLAVFADVGVSVLAICNAIRAFRIQ